MTWVFYQSHLLSKARKQAWEKKLPFWISVGSWAKTNDNLAAAWNTSRLVFWSAGSSYAFSQVRITDYCLCKADRIHFFQIFVNLGCCTYILPIMILQPGKKSLVSSKTTSGIVKTIKMTATYMHLEKHSISKFSLTCGLGIVYWELNLANVSKPADLMTDWDFCCILLNCVNSWVVNLHLASKSACVSIPFYPNSKPNNTTNCYIYSFLAALSWQLWKTKSR